ncbi:hypothetical protein LNV09_17870 [Paucibacter sp. B2R-40]|uniref:hypothetical protein n=1 Tax=Paucibacter sp. B2R-40 TaxID=2893554 RepID=UPI0021E4A783|nr:hypothetical protein [Paucibacter sp. B2R-40]MCV2356012.1 hypothetical protein [Paucibacter sp. B2R-40]
MLVMTASPVAANKGNMDPDQEGVSNRRSSEASILWKTKQNDGFTSSSIVALDFVCFSDEKEDAERLAKVLSENCTVGINPNVDSGYWLFKGSGGTLNAGLTTCTDMQQFLGVDVGAQLCNGRSGERLTKAPVCHLGGGRCRLIRQRFCDQSIV